MQFTSTAREDVNRAVTLRHGLDRGKPMTWREACQHPSMFDQENSIDAIVRIVDGKIEYIDTVRPEDPTGYFEPRPGYRAPQNPILAALRADCGDPSETVAEVAEWYLLDLDDSGNTPEHIDHARKVLTRLANVYKED